MINKLLGFIKDHKLQFAGGVVLASLTIFTGMGLMGTSGYLISRAAERPLITDLFMVTAAVRFFGISRAVVRYFERVVSHDLTFRILLVMRNMLYATLDKMSLHWMMQRRPGDLLARLVTDTEQMQHAFLRQITPVIVAVTTSLITCILLWYVDPRLALTTLVFLSLSGIGLPLLAVRLSRNRGRAEVRYKSAMKVYLVDRIQGLQDVLWMGREKHDQEQFTELQNELDSLQSRYAGNHGLLEGLNITLTHLGTLVVLLLSVPLVISGEIRGVMLALLTLVVLSSFEAVQNLAHAYLDAEATDRSASRFFGVVENKTPVNTLFKENAGTVPGDLSGDLLFQGVSFSYEKEYIALHDISFTIEQGSKTAIVGPTGSGKSTLVNLLLRFWDVDKGLIEFGGHDIREINTTHLRTKFGVMAQDVFIFNRSLRDNLLVAKPGATDKELVSVLQKVGLGRFASDLDMFPGSFGMRLSGGERQLVALARVLLKDAPVWVFDEPAANLDATTERHILDLIWLAGGKRTCIMITHRLVDMDKMDQILVMDKGRLIERGTHMELMESDTFYRRMQQHQQGNLAFGC